MEKDQHTVMSKTCGVKPLTIILVEPQMGANIGSAARVIKNFNLGPLRLVRPRDGWPNPKAVPLAAGADDVLDQVQVFDSLAEASHDLHHLVGTSARRHDIIKEFYTPHQSVEHLYPAACEGARIGIAFGSERSGLTNEDLSLCESVVFIPTNPEFYSLNLSQSVGIYGYEWRMQVYENPENLLRTGYSQPATKNDLIQLFEHLERELDHSGFLRNEKKRPTMVQNLRNLFQRSHLTEQEVRTLRGIIRSLVEGPKNLK